ATGTSPSVQVETGKTVSSTGLLTLNTPLVNNLGTLSTSNAITATQSGDFNITGSTGILSATNGMTFTSSAGNVVVSQFSISGQVSGSAGLAFAVSASGSGLSVGSIQTTSGNLTISAGLSVPTNTPTTISVAPNAILKANEGNL